MSEQEVKDRPQPVTKSKLMRLYKNIFVFIMIGLLEVEFYTEYKAGALCQYAAVDTLVEHRVAQ